MWILPLQKTCNFICILNAGCHQVKPSRQQRSGKARDPQVPCSWGPLPSSSCTASDATSTRSFTTSTWPSAAAHVQRSSASGSPCGRDISRWMWRKESQPKPVGIERSSPDGHRPQRPRAILRLHVHLRLGREKQLDHLREAVECRSVQRGPASVRSPSCGCASGHLPLQSSVPSCWSRCLLQGLFHSLHVWSDYGQSPHLLALYQVYHSHADITNRICWIRWIRWLSLHRPIVPWCIT